MPSQTFKSFNGQIAADGTTTILIHHDNATMEWDIYQVSVNSSGNGTVTMLMNGFFVSRSGQASGDTAIGPPDIILTRSDVMSLVFGGGNPGDRVVVGVWFTENPAGQTLDLSP